MEFLEPRREHCKGITKAGEIGYCSDPELFHCQAPTHGWKNDCRKCELQGQAPGIRQLEPRSDQFLFYVAISVRPVGSPPRRWPSKHFGKSGTNQFAGCCQYTL